MAVIYTISVFQDVAQDEVLWDCPHDHITECSQIKTKCSCRRILWALLKLWCEGFIIMVNLWQEEAHCKQQPTSWHIRKDDSNFELNERKYFGCPFLQSRLSEWPSEAWQSLCHHELSKTQNSDKMRSGGGDSSQPEHQSFIRSRDTGLYHYQLLCRSEGSDRYTIIIIISAGSGNQEQPGATFVTFVYLHKDG